MKVFGSWLRALPAYLWSGWGAIASLLMLLAAWEAISLNYGPLVLPDPRATFATLLELVERGEALPTLAVTARRALAGLGLAVLVGSVTGFAAGLFPTTATLTRPLATVLMGTPPIAWLVLAMLWFGTSDGTPVFTVFIACFPLVFVGALQGARTLDGQLREVARAFALPARMRALDVYLPHMLSYLFPSWISALGNAWKVVVMAELLSSSDGVGAALAATRTQMDTAGTLAWISAVVGLLLAIEYLLLEPVRRELERWRAPQS